MKSKVFFCLSFLVFVLFVAGCAAPTATPTATPLATASENLVSSPEMGVGLVTITKSYYPENGKLVEEPYFASKQVDLGKYEVYQNISPKFAELIGEDVIAGFIPAKDRFNYITTEGNQQKAPEAKQAETYLFLLADGTYVEVRNARDPNLGSCTVGGVSLNGKTVLVLIKDSGGQKKLLTFDIVKDSKLFLRIVSSYRDEPVTSNLYIDSTTNWAVGIKGEEVRVFNDKTILVAVAWPCLYVK
jgi:hypothetical protein